MARLMNLDAETGANIIDDDAQPTLTLANTSTGPGLKVYDFNGIPLELLQGLMQGIIIFLSSGYS